MTTIFSWKYTENPTPFDNEFGDPDEAFNKACDVCDKSFSFWFEYKNKKVCYLCLKKIFICQTCGRKIMVLPTCKNCKVKK
jgi:hypothetical protein